MARTPSGGWREVYGWCSVKLPMTLREAATSGEADCGEATTMEDRETESEPTDVERYAKRKVQEVARDLESAQGAATVAQLVEEIEAAGTELAYVKTQIEQQRN